MLEFLSTLNGQVYSTIQNILESNKKITIWLKGEKDCLVFNEECSFFLTQEGLKVKDGRYTTFVWFEEIRTVR